jgi:hypothetical protein
MYFIDPPEIKNDPDTQNEMMKSLEFVLRYVEVYCVPA